MTEFIDVRLSDRVSYGFTGGPAWNTLVRDLNSGRKKKNGEWDLPHHKYSADYALLDADEKEEVLAAFYVTRGQLIAFRFKDWNDFKAIDQPLVVPVTNTTPIQLLRTYMFGPTSYSRVITLPLGAALKFDGVPFAGFTVNALTGIATPTTTWPAGAPTWDGEFDVRVCFSKDFNPFTRARPKVSTTMVELEEDFG